MEITVFGTGYVGLVSGSCFADVGNDGLCLELDPEKICILEAGFADLFASGASVSAYNSVAMRETQRIFGDESRLPYAENTMGVLTQADALAIFDGRKLYDSKFMRGLGIEYFAIGSKQ